MSEFTDGVTAPAVTQEQVDQTEDYLAQWVGEGKKYQNVEEAAKALAKKAANADTFIETLKAEKYELESKYNEIQTRNRSIDEIIQAIKQPEPPKPKEEPVNTQNLSVDEVIAEFEKRSQQKQQAEAQQTRIKSTWEKLSSQEVFGDIEKAKVAVATYIGNDPHRKSLVDQMAVADPEGLVTLLKQNKAVVTFSEDYSTQSSDPNVTPQGTLTWEIAKQIRKDNPKLYHSKAFQNRMHTEL